MGDLVEGRWQTPEERTCMRALDREIFRLTHVIAALREAHACERANRSRRAGEIIQFSTARADHDA
jgi:hypothetical protein